MKSTRKNQKHKKNKTRSSSTSQQQEIDDLQSVVFCCCGLTVTIFVPQNISKLQKNLERGGIMDDSQDPTFIKLDPSLKLDNSDDFEMFIKLLDKLYANIKGQ